MTSLGVWVQNQIEFCLAYKFWCPLKDASSLCRENYIFGTTDTVFKLSEDSWTDCFEISWLSSLEKLSSRLCHKSRKAVLQLFLLCYIAVTLTSCREMTHQLVGALGTRATYKTEKSNLKPHYTQNIQ